MRPPIVALLTDFGLKDPYVGLMKGVLLTVQPDARIVDLSHDIAPQAVLDAQRVLSQACGFFPKGTIFVAVVDPGVGSSRAILGVETERHVFLAPDNGLLSFVEKARRIVRIENERYFLKPVSDTFHGRDIFAPVAGHLARGLDLGRLGPRIGSIERLRPPAPRVTPTGDVVGEVMAVDRFGNLVTNIPAQRLARVSEIRLKRHRIARLLRTYAEARRGDLFGIVGSTGHLEISVNRGSAARKTGAAVGDPVRVKPA